MGGLKIISLTIRGVIASYNYASMRCDQEPISIGSDLIVGVGCGTRSPKCFGGSVTVCYGIPSSPICIGLSKGTRWLWEGVLIVWCL